MITCKVSVVIWYQMVIVVSWRTGLGVWDAGQHVSMFSVTVLRVHKLNPCKDTLELSAELRTLTVSILKATAPKENTKK